MSAGAQTRTEVRNLLERHGLRPATSLGQHFLTDRNLIAKMVELVGGEPGDQVVEVGVGTGTLTAALAGAGYRVLGFEVDQRLRPVLDEVLVDVVGVEVRFTNVMAVDLAGELGEGSWVMAANLPYQVGTPLLLSTLREVDAVRRFVVMLQREVAERVVAAPGTPEYGLPSVVVGLHGEARLAFSVPPQVFLPPPRVASAVVTIDRRAKAPDTDWALWLASAGFGQRRKMLRSALAGALANAPAALERAGIDPKRRAESVTPREWLDLAGVTRG